MKLAQRFLVCVVLAFWQGGFTFYASVVVPVAQTDLGHLRQGFITRRVTDQLNISGAVALAVLAFAEAFSKDSSTVRRRLRWLAWLGMVAALVWLVWLHGRLDELLHVEKRRILDFDPFTTFHRTYLWVSTVQWGLALLYFGLLLKGWQAEDRGA